MPEQQPLGADFLSVPRRRRPRVDPTLLDWKKLTGEENVSVINRETGKKVRIHYSRNSSRVSSLSFLHGRENSELFVSRFQFD